MKVSLDAAYFERVYAANPDPWGFETSAFEAKKYRASLAALPRDQYAEALEIGSSIGVFSTLLAARTKRLLGTDVNAKALACARERCVAMPFVRFELCSIPRQFPTGRFDLVVCSEVAYYWSDADLALAIDEIARALVPGGDVLLVHFLPAVPDYVRTGDAVHAIVLADGRFTHITGTRSERYRIDVVRRRA